MSLFPNRIIPRKSRDLCPGVDCSKDAKHPKGLTEQAHTESCDINVILARLAPGALAYQASLNPGRYDDVSSIDFQDSMNKVALVKNMFESLPAVVRAEFEHNPVKFLDYVQDDKNHEALAKRGLLIGNDGFDYKGSPVASPVRKDGDPKPDPQTVREPDNSPAE